MLGVGLLIGNFAQRDRCTRGISSDGRCIGNFRAFGPHAAMMYGVGCHVRQAPAGTCPEPAPIKGLRFWDARLQATKSQPVRLALGSGGDGQN